MSAMYVRAIPANNSKKTIVFMALLTILGCGEDVQTSKSMSDFCGASTPRPHGLTGAARQGYIAGYSSAFDGIPDQTGVFANGFYQGQRDAESDTTIAFNNGWKCD